MSVVIPFRDPRPKAMLASRRAYRESCKQLVAIAFAEAFNQSLRQPAVSNARIEEVSPIFVATVRRELKRIARGSGFRLVRA